MNEKLKNYLKTQSISELAGLRQITSALCGDYDKNLMTYANLNGDTSFTKMPKDIESMHERRNRLFALLMSINSIIEEKLFNLHAQ